MAPVIAARAPLPQTVLQAITPISGLPDSILFEGGDTNLFNYALDDPINLIDRNGLVLDTAADIGFVFYDLYRLVKDGPCNLGENLGTLAADVAGVLIPDATGLGLGVSAASKTKGLGNPFRGKTFEQIDEMFKRKEFEPRGPDPLGGKGGYVNPKTGRSYHLDPGGEYKKGVEKPHVDVNRPSGSSLPKKKFEL